MVGFWLAAKALPPAQTISSVIP